MKLKGRNLSRIEATDKNLNSREIFNQVFEFSGTFRMLRLLEDLNIFTAMKYSFRGDWPRHGDIVCIETMDIFYREGINRNKFQTIDIRFEIYQ